MNYLKRKIDHDLIEWKNSESRKPLLVRGARQVGKSSAVRELGKKFDHFLEINFENKNNEAAKKIFERHSNPKPICEELSAIYETPIIAGQTLLFLDEILEYWVIYMITPLRPMRRRRKNCLRFVQIVA